MAQVTGFLPILWETWIEFLPALAWPSPSPCEHVGNEPVDVSPLNLSICLPLS